MDVVINITVILAPRFKKWPTEYPPSPRSPC
jgi:hypothetical protein